MINAASPAAYNELLGAKVLCLPSIRTLKKETRRVSSARCPDNASYLNLRVSKLSEYEQKVVLMIDEIYIAKRVEYSVGEVHGLTND